MERSAEWLRGEKAALRRLKPEVWGQGLKAYSTRDLRQLVDSDYFKAERELAAAEAHEASQPTTTEVIAAVEKALKGALRLDPHCDHAEIHREGFLWTVCDQCGRRWADDEGGFKTDPANKYIVKVDDALAIIAQWKEAHHAK